MFKRREPGKQLVYHSNFVGVKVQLSEARQLLETLQAGELVFVEVQLGQLRHLHEALANS